MNSSAPNVTRLISAPTGMGTGSVKNSGMALAGLPDVARGTGHQRGRHVQGDPAQHEQLGHVGGELRSLIAQGQGLVVVGGRVERAVIDPVHIAGDHQALPGQVRLDEAWGNDLHHGGARFDGSRRQLSLNHTVLWGGGLTCDAVPKTLIWEFTPQPARPWLNRQLGKQRGPGGRRRPADRGRGWAKACRTALSRRRRLRRAAGDGGAGRVRRRPGQRARGAGGAGLRPPDGSRGGPARRGGRPGPGRAAPGKVQRDGPPHGDRRRRQGRAARVHQCGLAGPVAARGPAGAGARGPGLAVRCQRRERGGHRHRRAGAVRRGRCPAGRAGAGQAGRRCRTRTRT